MTFLTIEDIMKVYPRKRGINISALRGINLTIEKNSFNTLIGPSGSGKTTLLNLISGYDFPTAGKIEIDQIGVISNLKGKRLQDYHLNSLGFIHQDPKNNIIGSWSVKQNIIFPMKLKGGYNQSEYAKKIRELTKIFSLDQRLSFPAKKLSGGEAQRLGIAIALVNDPKLILADEPSGELDSENTKIIIDHFKNVLEIFDTTIIAVTHNSLFANESEVAWEIVDGKIKGMFSSSKDSITEDKQEYFTYVDPNGALQIPEEIMKKAQVDKKVKIQFNEKTGRIEIIP